MWDLDFCLRVEHNFVNKQLDSKSDAVRINLRDLRTVIWWPASELAAWGIGVHHAGLTREDRSATERLYLKKALKVLFATSASRFHDIICPAYAHWGIRRWRSVLIFVSSIEEAITQRLNHFL